MKWFKRKKPQLSSVAGIVDPLGGLRVVVTQRWRMQYHVGRGERIYIVPDLLVQEPVPWDEIPAVIAKAERYVNHKIAPKNACGDCKVCCITPYLKTEKFEKPSHAVCTNCVSYGCKIYFNRPQPCKDFACLWLKSQQLNDVMPLELRPDKCGVMFTDDSDGDKEVFEVHVNQMTEVASAYIDNEQAIGRKAKLVTFYHGENKSL